MAPRVTMGQQSRRNIHAVKAIVHKWVWLATTRSVQFAWRPQDTHCHSGGQSSNKRKKGHSLDLANIYVIDTRLLEHLFSLSSSVLAREAPQKHPVGIPTRSSRLIGMHKTCCISRRNSRVKSHNRSSRNQSGVERILRSFVQSGRRTDRAVIHPTVNRRRKSIQLR
jgi:hypothetical protein